MATTSPGVFDLSSGAPVATELATVVAQLARGETPNHPALKDVAGGADDRACFPPCEELVEEAA